jgi:aspartate/methionine/tyrosine aminotransferase
VRGRPGIALISDEIYDGLDYAFPAETAHNVSVAVVVINSTSRYFCMTGRRIGRMPEALVPPIERLQQNVAISVPAFSDFDPVHRKRFIRFCYASATAGVTEAWNGWRRG